MIQLFPVVRFKFPILPKLCQILFLASLFIINIDLPTYRNFVLQPIYWNIVSLFFMMLAKTLPHVFLCFIHFFP